MSSDSAGVEATWRAAKWVNFSGWAGASFAEQANATIPGTNKSPSATVFNWALAAAFPDLLATGNVGAIIVGQEPTLISGSAKGTL